MNIALLLPGNVVPAIRGRVVAVDPNERTPLEEICALGPIKYTACLCHRPILADMPQGDDRPREQYRKRFVYFSSTADRDMALHPLLDHFQRDFEDEIDKLVGPEGVLFYRLKPVGQVFDDAKRQSYRFGFMIETIYAAVRPESARTV